MCCAACDPFHYRHQSGDRVIPSPGGLYDERGTTSSMDGAEKRQPAADELFRVTSGLERSSLSFVASRGSHWHRRARRYLWETKFGSPKRAECRSISRRARYPYNRRAPDRRSALMARPSRNLAADLSQRNALWASVAMAAGEATAAEYRLQGFSPKKRCRYPFRRGPNPPHETRLLGSSAEIGPRDAHRGRTRTTSRPHCQTPRASPRSARPPQCRPDPLQNRREERT